MPRGRKFRRRGGRAVIAETPELRERAGAPEAPELRRAPGTEPPEGTAELDLVVEGWDLGRRGARKSLRGMILVLGTPNI